MKEWRKDNSEQEGESMELEHKKKKSWKEI